ncbi:MAG: MMPL family transporter [Ruminiclostridium sp.]|nr:MMPL family transporter [Ruminiclostridium sp.]
MKTFYRSVVGHRKPILIVFLLLFILCVPCRQLVSVNYDINDYLPADSPSTLALDLMEQEYDGGIPNARVMIRNVSIAEALAYKADLQAVEGVSDVTWLDDTASPSVPLEALDPAITEPYYRDGNALYTVTIQEDARLSAVEDIRAIIGEGNAVTGSAVSTADATAGTITEVAITAAIAVAFTFVVLLLTTYSFAEPVLVLAGIGVAVVINGGTNLIFGEISFVTNAAGSILQLAVSLDYSVFLLHRFEDCRKINPDPEEAMVEALSLSTSSILSSGLTTVIGFLALCFMRFRIGPDLGLALAKGVAISLVTVFLLMPALILSTYKLIDKTRHRPFVPSFRPFGKLVRRCMLPLAVVFALLIVPGYLASNANSFYYGGSHIFGPDTRLGADTEAIEEAFGKQDTYVLMVPKGNPAVETELSAALHKIPQMTSILSYVDTVGTVIPEEYLDSGTLSKLTGEHYTRMVLTLRTDYEGDQAFALVETIRDTAETYYPGQWYLAGGGVSTCDLMKAVTSDMVKVNLVAIAAVFFILLLTMRSVILPVILVLSIETAIWINLSLPYFSDQPIFYLAYLITSSVQLGATVDYAILFATRYREFRQSFPKKQAVVETVTAVSVSILTSASAMVVIGFLLGIISSHGLLSQLGFFLGKGTLCSLAIVLFALPGLLVTFDSFILPHKKSKEAVPYETL